MLEIEQTIRKALPGLSDSDVMALVTLIRLFQTGSSSITFGSNNQFGDISIENIAARDVNKVEINLAINIDSLLNTKALSQDSNPKERKDAIPVVGGFVIGITELDFVPWFELFGDSSQSKVENSEITAFYEELVFDDLQEMNNVLLSMKRIVTKVSSVSEKERGVVFEKAWKEEVIEMMSEKLFANETYERDSSLAPGIKYFVWLFRIDIAGFIQLLRDQYIESKTFDVLRDAIEVRFSSASGAAQIPRVINKAMEISNGDSTLFRKNLFKYAMLLRNGILIE